jgi:hypothetical protein
MFSFRHLLIVLCLLSNSAPARMLDWPAPAAELMRQREDQANEAYRKSRFSLISRDYLARFHVDPGAVAGPTEIVLKRVTIALPEHASEVATNMARALQTFLNDRMGVPTELGGPDKTGVQGYTIKFARAEAGENAARIIIGDTTTSVLALDDDGIRDGVVSLIDRIGLRGAAILAPGVEVLRPQIAERIGAVPWLGSLRDVALLGFNGVLVKPYADLHEISSSSVLPEIAYLQNADSVTRLSELAREARRWGLRPYIHINNRTRFAEDHPLFIAHPGTRGVKVREGDTYILSTNDSTVSAYVEDTIRGLFSRVPELAGVLIIVGGEGFYHCYMHPQGFPKGKTDSHRCGSQGPDETVAHLVNGMTKAARSVNPDARIIAWPYSAHHVWTDDPYQTALIRKIDPEAGVQTEVINGEVVRHSDGIETSYWDYSLGALGPSERARAQIGFGHQTGHRVYVHAEPELSLDFGGVPFVPAATRWLARAEAVARSGADGVMATPYFREFNGSLGAEIQKFAWFIKPGGSNDIVDEFAKRVASQGAATLKKAWDILGEAIALSPQVPTYFTGPQFLGPAHPLMLDPATVVPEVFSGQLLYLAEISADKALQFTRSFVRAMPEVKGVVRLSRTGVLPAYMPAANTIDNFAVRYRRIEHLLKEAVGYFDQTLEVAPQANRLLLESEASIVRWFWHTARSTANFYESHRLRECAASRTIGRPQALACHTQLIGLIDDERSNATAALMVVQNDPRVDLFYHPFLTLSHTEDMIKEKLRMLEHDRTIYLPGIHPG